MKRNVLLINCAAAFLWLGMYSYVPTLPSFATTLGATAVMLGVIGGAYGAMQILLRIPLGMLSDKTGKDKLLLIIGFVVLTLSVVLFLFADTVETVIFARGVAGAAAAWWVIISASYAKYNDESKQVKAQGILSASSSLGKVLAALLGGIAAQFFGLRAPFYVALLAAVIGLIIMLFLKKPATLETHEPPTAKELLSLLKNKDLMIISILCVFAQLQCFAVPTYFTSVAAQNIGADPGQLGSLTLVYFLTVGLISLFVGGRLYQKIGGIKVVVAAFLLCAFSCVPFFYHMSLPVIYIMQMIAGIGYGILTSALAGFVIKAVLPHQRSTATGIFQSVYAIGIFVGPVIAGGVIEAASFDTAYWVIGGITLLAAFLSGIFIPRKYGEM